jgi:hypothetical protein
MKDLSHLGFDVVRNRKIDYGNFQYRTVVHLWCACDSRIRDHLALAARKSFDALDVSLEDTDGTLNKQGDVVEMMMAACRAHRELGLRSVHESTAEWNDMGAKLNSFCRSVDYLYSCLMLKPLKVAPCDPPPRRLPFEFSDVQRLRQSSYAFSRLAIHTSFLLG